MWAITVSDGRTFTGIKRESDARRIVHRDLHATQMRGVYSWQGNGFTVELHRGAA